MGDMSAELQLCSECGERIKWHRAGKSERGDCSSGCPSDGLTITDRRLEKTILHLLGQRAQSATICPSEAARTVADGDWRPLMEPARRAARRLVAAGKVDITQQGGVVDPALVKGPIRIRLRS